MSPGAASRRPRCGATPSWSRHAPSPGQRVLRLTRRLAPGLALACAAVVGCREDAQSPTGPESGPVLATTATTALAFSQGFLWSFTWVLRGFCLRILARILVHPFAQTPSRLREVPERYRLGVGRAQPLLANSACCLRRECDWNRGAAVALGSPSRISPSRIEWARDLDSNGDEAMVALTRSTRAYG